MSLLVTGETSVVFRCRVFGLGRSTGTRLRLFIGYLSRLAGLLVGFFMLPLVLGMVRMRRRLMRPVFLPILITLMFFSTIRPILGSGRSGSDHVGKRVITLPTHTRGRQLVGRWGSSVVLLLESYSLNLWSSLQ